MYKVYGMAVSGNSYKVKLLLEQMGEKYEWREINRGGRYSIADIALYAYTHCAADGGFDLGRYPGITRWLEGVRSQPGYAPLG